MWSFYTSGNHCIKSVRIRSYSGPHFPAFELNTERLRISPYSVRMRENADQTNSKYRHFSCSRYWIYNSVKYDQEFLEILLNWLVSTFTLNLWICGILLDLLNPAWLTVIYFEKANICAAFFSHFCLVPFKDSDNGSSPYFTWKFSKIKWLKVKKQKV